MSCESSVSLSQLKDHSNRILHESNQFKIFKLNLSENKTKIEEIEKCSGDSLANQIKTYYENLRMDVQASTNSRIDSIRKFNSKILDKISAYENSVLQTLGN